MVETVAIVNYGAIGQVLAAGLLEGRGPQLVAVLVRPRQVEEGKAALPAGVAVVTTLPELLQCSPGSWSKAQGRAPCASTGSTSSPREST